MSRSLRRVFSLQDQLIGTRSEDAFQKQIKSPNRPNERKVVPGYINDHVWKDDQKISQPDIDVITGSENVYSKHNIIKRKQADVTTAAVNEPNADRKQLRDK